MITKESLIPGQSTQTLPFFAPPPHTSDSVLKIPPLLPNIPLVLTLDPEDQCLPGQMVFGEGKQGSCGCLDLCWNMQDESEHLCSFGHSAAHHMICREQRGATARARGSPELLKLTLFQQRERKKRPCLHLPWRIHPLKYKVVSIR